MPNKVGNSFSKLYKPDRKIFIRSGFSCLNSSSFAIKTHAPDWPVISLDALRAEVKIKPTDNQDAVVARAREKAREYLRCNQNFIWNATNISRQMREHCLSLCAAYNARIRIVYLETSAEKLFEQNRSRDASVPNVVMNKLISRWETPDLTEAHRIDLIYQ